MAFGSLIRAIFDGLALSLQGLLFIDTLALCWGSKKRVSVGGLYVTASKPLFQCKLEWVAVLGACKIVNGPGQVDSETMVYSHA